ncbi:diguanylate cyclase/phosphodiesterase (GGDEF & EAL domains) with PAS/PAC sensor(s) [hydrothermal vent metagenome]|uniref:Diguanylate cyclase/phosphodiesterase (GGDEF & EAL domains) with PAS/PAC sensor(S) n=1 Tax=hydrothermal vent metagenome TaxID=652676 RepID=A0A1W1EF51_9ZZZZ
MLLSELKERERRFKLALRAGIPIVILIFLVLYSTILKDNQQDISFDLETALMSSAILFISVYFIYFLIDLSVKETLIDNATHGYNEKAFISQIVKYKPNTLALLVIKNLSTISENYSNDDVDLLLYNIVHKLDNMLRKKGFKDTLISRRYGAEFLIAINNNENNVQEIFEEFTSSNKIMNEIEIDYNFSIITNIGDDIEKDILYLKDLLPSQKRSITNSKNVRVSKDAKELSQIEDCIIGALKNNDLILSYRPLLNTQTNKIDIYEISVKLKSKGPEPILPRIYLPILNRLGLGRDYDFALVKKVLETLPLIDDEISLSFNLSPFSLRDEKFQNNFFDYLDRSAVDSNRLIIELYERKTHHDLSGYLKTLNKFRTRGVRIAIDNFGSSNASMEYMKNFRFDIVQFDRDYVTKLDDSNTYTMLESLVEMSKNLHIVTVAKWVDNEMQKEKLKKLGINYFQGFGIGKPISQNKLIDIYN